MDDFNKENSPSNLELRLESLEKLIKEAEGNLLKTDSEELAKKLLFEIYFLRLAIAQTEEFRLRSSNREPAAPEYITEYKEILDRIRHNGDWTLAKREIVDYYLSSDLTYEAADELGIDREFSNEGVKIFSERPPNTIEPGEAFRKFVEGKVGVVPDKTKPYDHPNMAELKNKVEFGI